MLYLILHQRNEWSYHNADALLGKGWNLEGDGFTATCRHKPEGILTSGYTLDDVSLYAAKVRIPPNMYVVFLDIYLPFFETFALTDFDAFARPDGFALQIRVIRVISA